MNELTYSTYSESPPRKHPRLLVAGALLLLMAVLLLAAISYWRGAQLPQGPNYQLDLQQLEEKHRNLAQADPQSAFVFYQLAKHTGNFATAHDAEQALEVFAQDRELNLIRAKLLLSMHEVVRGKALLETLGDSRHDSRLQDLQLDLYLQQGEYQNALAMLDERLAEAPQWSDIALYAHLLHKFGDSALADQFYQAAQTRLSVKQIKDYAWLELQRGIMDLENKQYPAARIHFSLANQIYPGHWLIEEHLAETLALLGETAEAIKLYEGVIQKSDNPLYFYALGSLLETTDTLRARQLKQDAEAHFLQRYKHYPLAAAGHLLDVWIEQQHAHPTAENRARLLELSQANVQARPNAEALIQRIQVLQLDQQNDAAQQLAQQLAATPWRTADVIQIAKTYGIPLAQPVVLATAPTLLQALSLRD